MKKNKLINKLLIACCLSVILISCDDDDNDNLGVSFSSIASTTTEDGGGTLTIPLRDGSVSVDEIVFGGTAKEGEDFELVGVLDEGIQINIINDNVYESSNETIRIQIPSSGNSFHTVTINEDASDCQYAVYDDVDWAGSYEAIEDYGEDGTYGPYTVSFSQDSEDPNKYTFADFWDSGISAYIVFDPATETVSFPSQVTAYGTITGSGTYEYDVCSGYRKFTIDTHFTYGGGYDWVYVFETE